MAFEGGLVNDLSFTATSGTGILSDHQFHAVKLSAAGVVALSTSSTGGTARVVGILQNDPASDEAATVRVLGYSKWECGEAIALNDALVCSSSGTAFVANTTGEYVVGWAASATTAAGQILTAYINPGYMFAGSTA